MTEPFNFLRKKTHKRNISKKTRKRNIKKNKKTRNKQYGGTDRKILGMGSYGLIVSPAFPNGKTFTNNTVSKIFKSKYVMDNIIKFVKTVKEKIPLLDIDITEYTKQYKVSNVNENRITYKGTPTSIHKELKNIDKIYSYVTPNSMIYQVRMPNLGFSCSDINNNPTLYEKMRLIDYRIIFMEILKLLCTVRQIHRNGYIHGDVREPNIMCDLNNGKLTIIDFDLFNTIDDFYENFPSYSYSHPPECVAIFGKFYMDSLLDDIYKIIGRIKHLNNYLIQIYDDINIKLIHDNIKEALRQFKNKGVEYENKEVEDDIYKYSLYTYISRFIDSWGLMLGICSLIENAWYYVEKKGEFKEMYEYITSTLIPNMCDADMHDRWDATTGIQEYYSVLKRSIPEFCSSYLEKNPKVNDELQSMNLK